QRAVGYLTGYNVGMAGKLLVAIAILVGACGLRAQQLGDGERAALERAGEHADRWRPGFAGLAADERAAYTFLLRHMPERDLAGLSPELVRENVQLACDVRRHVAWGAALSDELFWNDVVPYAQANETREAWRPWMVRDWLPLVQDCETPGEAAQVLNRRIFDLIEVHYSTGRRRADQSPSESIEQGKATCTGLSILLADACRACCVPARLVSVRWPHKRGNHTWVEVWDGAAWRFCGADEPDPKGLDRAWFVGDAARCVDADRDHRIWAVSFAATGERFAAGWGRVQLWGVDVTDRYAPKAAVRQVEAPAAAGGDDALLAQLARWFAADDARRATFGFDRNLDEELRTRRGDTRLRALVWQALRAHERPRLQVDHTARVARVGDAACSFTVEQVGERPAGGWPLVIALHGDAEPPRRTPTGDEDAPAPGGYLYCALRASDDLLGGARPGAFDAVVERLIRQ
ncbi:MAG: transglutaminase domain-containing protein, partial [Planctomycetes bacterium]|nr:transglutaminase domain-containing protein [Planctomycetota bacterium]